MTDADKEQLESGEKVTRVLTELILEDKFRAITEEETHQLLRYIHSLQGVKAMNEYYIEELESRVNTYENAKEQDIAWAY